METIAEENAPPPAAPRQTGTIVEVPSEPPPPAGVAPAPAPTSTPAPAPTSTPTPTPTREITEDEASHVLRGFVTSRTYYEGVSTQCVQLRGTGYRNVGYGFTVWDSCVEGGGSRMLGRWRVDAKTREVFRQQEDGRYLRP